MEQTKVTVTVPAGCKRTDLNIRALDTRSRELAQGTFVTVEGKMLQCYRATLLHDGCLQLIIPAEAYEFLQGEPE